MWAVRWERWQNNSLLQWSYYHVSRVLRDWDGFLDLCRVEEVNIGRYYSSWPLARVRTSWSTLDEVILIFDSNVNWQARRYLTPNHNFWPISSGFVPATAINWYQTTALNSGYPTIVSKLDLLAFWLRSLMKCTVLLPKRDVFESMVWSRDYLPHHL
jgi:hypothetical protein